MGLLRIIQASARDWDLLAKFGSDSRLTPKLTQNASALSSVEPGAMIGVARHVLIDAANAPGLSVLCASGGSRLIGVGPRTSGKR